MMAFGIHESLHAAALVLLLMNIATLLPAGPGKIGLVQAVAPSPALYGVAYWRGSRSASVSRRSRSPSASAWGSCSWRARASYAMLKTMPGPTRPTTKWRLSCRRPRSPCVLALASPASLKSVLKPVEAALASAAGLREGVGGP